MITVLMRFEGPTGCGKTRLANLVQEFLESKGFSCLNMEENHTMSVIKIKPKEKA